MVDVELRRKQRAMKIVAKGERFMVRRWVGLDSEHLQEDGTWTVDEGKGFATVEAAWVGFEANQPETISNFNLSMDIDTLIEIIHEAGYPTEGYLASWLWETLGRLGSVSGPMAGDIYRALGYVPHEGYPLKRAV